MTEEVTQPTQTNPAPAENTEPSWFIAEGVPGPGERPEWLGDKFKTVADLAKSYTELEKRTGKVPDQYDFSKAEWIDPDYVPFQDLAAKAKEMRVPQEFIDLMGDSVGKYLSEFSSDPKEEMAKLGEGAKEKIEVLNNWAKANLSEDAAKALFSEIRTADAIKAIDELRSKMMENATQVPGGNSDANSNQETLSDIQSEMVANLEKYKQDTKYQAEIRARMERVSAQSQYVDKIQG